MSAIKGLKVKLHTGAINELTKAYRVACEYTAKQTLDLVKDAQVVPKDTGALEASMSIENRSTSKKTISIVHRDIPYAMRLYYHPEYNFHQDKNANARGEWLEPWTDGGSRAYEVRALFKKNMRKQGRRYIK